jgi:hypothetical protein
MPAGPAANNGKEDGLGTEKRMVLAMREAAGRGIEEAGNALHRTQAIFTQLRVVGAEAPYVGPALSEATHAYQQGMASFRSHSFMCAGEFAAASSDLSQAVAIMLRRALRSQAADEASHSPKGVHRPNSGERCPSQEDFSKIGRRLSRVSWLFEYGTLPAEVIEQARRIASWSEQLYREAQQLYRNGAWEDASEFMEAAEAAVDSAEHICKMCYLKEC